MTLNPRGLFKHILLGAHRPRGLTMVISHQHRETMGRLFGAELMFTWRPSQRLFIQRMIKAEDNVVLHVYNFS